MQLYVIYLYGHVFEGNLTYMAAILADAVTEILWSLDIDAAQLDANLEVYEAGNDSFCII